MAVLLIAEHNNKQLSANTLQCVSAAQQLSQETIAILVAGYDCQTVAETASQLPVNRVYVADHACYQHRFAENISELVCTLADNYSHIIAPASTFGKDLIPRIAALLDMAALSDVTNIIDANTFERPIYAGNAISTIKSHDEKIVMTIRPTAFSICEKTTITANVEKLNTIITANGVHFEYHEESDSKRPDLTTARIVIAGGRGVQTKENFQLIEQLADLLGAAIGASRAAVDAGFAPNDYQVGQTGKVIAPTLYIAIGISGAIQHTAGIKDSQTIVAINSDPEAPIMQLADYALVGDLFTVIPELISILKEE